MDLTEQALVYLNRDPILYVNLLEVLRRGSAELLWVTADGVLLYDRDSRSHMFSARTQEAAGRIFHLLPPDADLLYGYETWYLEELRGRVPLTREYLFYSCVWAKKEPPPPARCAGELRLLREDDANAVISRYENAWGDGAEMLEYVRASIRRGMYGAYVDGELAGFGGSHDEGSLGMLEVLPQYRRRGLAAALETALIRRTLDRGGYAFCQVSTDNRASLALQEELGLTRSAAPLFMLAP